MGKNKKKQFDVLIIGGGAAGMMAAITAARKQQKVCILEKLDKLGKKLFATGNGKCNFTNDMMNSECFHADKGFIEEVLDIFSVQDCLDFFHSIGIYPKNKNGYYYPNSEQASSVVTALQKELERLGVTICYEIIAEEILPQQDEVFVTTNKGNFIGKNLIIATGLLASPKLGSDGSLFTQIKTLGHRFEPILPALCGFYCKGLPFKKASGVRAQGTVTAIIDGKISDCDTGEIQFTDYGLSGIPVFQISSCLSKGIYHKSKVEIHINLLPDFDKVSLKKELNYRKSIYAEQTVAYLLNGLLNKKLSNIILEKTHLDEDIMIASLSNNEIENIAFCLQNLTVKVTNYRDYEFAQVCTGGIPLSDIDTKTLQSKFVKNIYFAGEILDVDGICGGYNLHFAWASGYIAAMSIVEK
ncbi:MAG: aminoacetone oxidase family FAD-binding enzyme [Agathobacter sp.]|nr:aminoacetone oxidase family FAD-binding enzyme [Agathobacter sp.]